MESTTPLFPPACPVSSTISIKTGVLLRDPHPVLPLLYAVSELGSLFSTFLHYSLVFCLRPVSGSRILDGKPMDEPCLLWGNRRNRRNTSDLPLGCVRSNWKRSNSSVCCRPSGRSRRNSRDNRYHRILDIRHGGSVDLVDKRFDFIVFSWLDCTIHIRKCAL
jgi:hypothetical protein